MMANDALAPIHPGEILKTEFMEPYKLSGNKLARALDVPAKRITEIVRGRRDISADTALRLARAFGSTPQFWMNLQSHYDLEVAEDDTGAAIREKIIR